MSSQHRFPLRNFRPDPEEYAPAAALLKDAGYDMTTYLRACLRALKAQPDATLAALRQEMAAVSAETPRGRPPAQKD